jgi:hypothetical protein
MKYFSIYVPSANNRNPPTPAQQEAMGKFVGEAAARGEFLTGGGFASLAKEGAVVRRTNGKSSVVDGPYVESKELIGGFAMLEYASHEAALAGIKRFLEVAGDGECVTYRIEEGPHPEA